MKIMKESPNFYSYGSEFSTMVFSSKDHFLNYFGYKDDIGKLIFANAKPNEKEATTTRMFIESFDAYMKESTKNGWWDTFTVSDIACESGTYICKIIDCKVAKNGYPMFIVHPIKKYTGNDLFTVEDIKNSAVSSLNMRYIAVMDVFGSSRLFSNMYWELWCHREDDFYHCNYNGILTKYMNKWIELKSRTDVDITTTADDKLAGIVAVELFLNGDLTIDDINEALQSKYHYQLYVEDIFDNLDKYAEEYPLFINKLIKKYHTEKDFYMKHKDDLSYQYTLDNIESDIDSWICYQSAIYSRYVREGKIPYTEELRDDNIDTQMARCEKVFQYQKMSKKKRKKNSKESVSSEDI
ncbi:MAG: hypothetical protein NC548_47505 [Lachnospiraceae bacterium]|nr:hypothetical protein [Lachnospiraceae bacterium]